MRLGASPITSADLHGLLDLVPDPTVVVDRDLRVVAASRAAGLLLDRRHSDLAGLSLDDFLPGGVLDPEAKLDVRRPDGSELPVEISVRVIEVDSGPVLMVAIRDVTERRGRAAALREAGERFKRLFEDGPVAMALVGDDLVLAEVNAAFCKLTGYSAEELSGLTFNDISHPDDRDVGLRLVRGTFTGEIPAFKLDKRYLKKDGEVVWVEVSVSSIRDEEGRPIKTLGVMQDITERRLALTHAHEELDRLARERDRILEFAGEGIYHVDEDGRITFANPAAAKMLGWPLEALLGKPAHELLHHTHADGSHFSRYDCPIHGPSERAVRHATDDVFWRRDGRSFAVHYTSAPVSEPGVAGAVVVFTDVSEQVAMQAALHDARARAARERLKAAEAERARWARELHDETLQGLAALHVQLASRVRTGTVDEMVVQMREAQEQIESEMDKLRGLIADLRPAALDELGLEASVQDLAERTQVVYGIEVDTRLELHDTEGAPQRLAPDVETAAYRIAQESLSNAARHAGASRVFVEVAQRDGKLRICVTDDGGGFDPGGESSGFGLRGMRERVDLLAGELEIGSQPGSGTKVTALLPVG
ncbi:MAG: PAS domain S-box protein [Thermoleophilaceae bacterium]